LNEVNPQYLDSFPQWFAINRQLFAECNATFELSQPSPASDKPALYADVDFDDGEVVGRITIWESGECEMEALYSSMGNFIWGENHAFDSIDHLDTALHRFFIAVKRPSQR
jgi:hypothetical protein